MRALEQLGEVGLGVVNVGMNGHGAFLRVIFLNKAFREYYQIPIRSLRRQQNVI